MNNRVLGYWHTYMHTHTYACIPISNTEQTCVPGRSGADLTGDCAQDVEDVEAPCWPADATINMVV